VGGGESNRFPRPYHRKKSFQHAGRKRKIVGEVTPNKVGQPFARGAKGGGEKEEEYKELGLMGEERGLSTPIPEKRKGTMERGAPITIVQKMTRGVSEGRQMKQKSAAEKS